MLIFLCEHDEFYIMLYKQQRNLQMFLIINMNAISIKLPWWIMMSQITMMNYDVTNYYDELWCHEYNNG